MYNLEQTLPFDYACCYFSGTRYAPSLNVHLICCSILLSGRHDCRTDDFAIGTGQLNRTGDTAVVLEIPSISLNDSPAGRRLTNGVTGFPT
jgi:hypothetical protein